MATHPDYVIANASGAAVRDDLNKALAAIVSNNSSATDPATSTTTYPHQWWYDTTAGQLKLRNAADDDWVVVPVLDSSGRLLIGTTSAETVSLGARLQIQEAGSAASALIKRNEDDSFASYLYFGKSRGTTAGSTTIVQSGDNLGEIRFTGADGSTEIGSIAASIAAAVDGTPSVGQLPGRLVFSTMENGASSPTERMRITGDGLVHMSDNPNDTGRFGSLTAHFIHSDRISWALLVENSNNTAPGGILIDFDDASPDDNSQSFIACQDSTTVRMRVWSDGDLDNHDNSYGAISDQKLKQDIVDAGSQWDDIKSLRVRKWRFIDDVAAYGDEAKTLIGVVAQEAETVSPGLIKNNPDLDEDGNDLGTVTKSVRYSVLYMKAIKALQEAQTRIETLETQHADLLARVAALEAAN
jgi:hypothetical protein